MINLQSLNLHSLVVQSLLPQPRVMRRLRLLLERRALLQSFLSNIAAICQNSTLGHLW